LPDFSLSQILASLVFGAAGFVCFRYGKKQASWKPMVAGLVLMGLPYVIRQAAPLCVAGVLILATLYVFRE
jgi:hypothetical protein